MVYLWVELSQKSRYFSEMHQNGTPIIVGFVRTDVRHSLQEQQRLMAVHGITKIYEDLDLCIRQRRKGYGDVVAVKRLALFADPKHLRHKVGMRHSMRAAIEALERAGATILELDTGRRRDDPAVREAMMLDAIDQLSRSRYKSQNIGRPRKEWTPEQKTIMRLHWFDHVRHHSNEAAAAAIRSDGVQASMSQVHKVLGPSRRAAGNPKVRKIAMAVRKDAPRVIYFIQNGEPDGPVKIGIAGDARARLRGLQTSHHKSLTLLGTIPGNDETERKMHARFDKYRLSGEWFACEGSLATFVNRLRNPKRATKT
jgi:hypothetical protein